MAYLFADIIIITTPLSRDVTSSLRAGDNVLISGKILTARDAAHKRFVELLEKGEPLPINLEGQIIYYAGPAPTPPGRASGSFGPTTSYRMDKYTPQLLERGLLGMIGKGTRSADVIDAMMRHGAVYFAATGGAAALIARSIVQSEVLCYDDLGAEAVRLLTVVDFPAIVAIDSRGANLYEIGRNKYKINREKNGG